MEAKILALKTAITAAAEADGLDDKKKALINASLDLAGDVLLALDRIARALESVAACERDKAGL